MEENFHGLFHCTPLRNQIWCAKGFLVEKGNGKASWSANQELFLWFINFRWHFGSLELMTRRASKNKKVGKKLLICSYSLIIVQRTSRVLRIVRIEHKYKLPANCSLFSHFTRKQFGKFADVGGKTRIRNVRKRRWWVRKWRTRCCQVIYHSYVGKVCGVKGD